MYIETSNISNTIRKFMQLNINVCQSTKGGNNFMKNYVQQDSNR